MPQPILQTSRQKLQMLSISIFIHLVVLIGIYFYFGKEEGAQGPFSQQRVKIAIMGMGSPRTHRTVGNPTSVDSPTSKERVPQYKQSQVDKLNFDLNSSQSSIENAQGEGVSTFKSYFHHIHSKIQSVLQYPLSLRRRMIEGRVILEIILDLNGRLVQSHIKTSSGSTDLDELALEAVQRAAPFMSYPLSLGTAELKQIEIQLPIEFRIQ